MPRHDAVEFVIPRHDAESRENLTQQVLFSIIKNQIYIDFFIRILYLCIIQIKPKDQIKLQGYIQLFASMFAMKNSQFIIKAVTHHQLLTQ